MAQCPVSGCEDELPSRSSLTCRNHWRAVPLDLRLAYNRAYTASHASGFVDYMNAPGRLKESKEMILALLESQAK